MARVLTGISNGADFNLANLDLNAIFASRIAVTQVLNDPITVKGIVYTSSLRIDFPGANSPMYLYGDGFSFAPDGRLLTGSVTALAFGPDQFDPNLIIQQFALPAIDFDSAMRSTNTLDDQALLAVILANNDRISLNNSSYVVRGYAGNDTIESGRGNDMLFGDEGNDSLNSFFGDDTVYGGSGDDTIQGGPGQNLLYGGTGNDRISTNNGNSTVEGGDGDDYISISGGILVARGEDGNDTLIGARADDQLFGGIGNDVLYGSYGNDFIDAGAGNNLIYGGGNFDTVSYQSSSSRVVIDLVNGTAQHGVWTDQLTDIEHVDGSNFNDTIAGNFRDNVIRGLGGDDWMRASAGNDTFEGGLGRDTVVYTIAASGVDANLLTRTGIKGPFSVDTFVSIENLIGSRYSDTLTGDDLGNVLKGMVGDDFIFGNGGGDRLDGGVGHDNLHGGAGNDELIGGHGFDSLFGGDGVDTAVYSGARSEYNITQNADGSFRIAHVRHTGISDGVDVAFGVEVLRFSDGSIFL